MRLNLYTPYVGWIVLCGWLPPKEIPIVAPKQFSEATDGNLIVSVFIERHPLCAFWFAHCMSVLKLPCTFAISPSAKGSNSEGELPHLEGRFPGSITPSFQEDCTGIVSGTSNPSFNKSCNGAEVNTWGFKLAFGSNQPHNNIAPLYGVYRFRRLT